MLHYEVEQKFRVASLKPTLAALVALDATPGEPATQDDCYYAHPQRDFAKTDEAFRLRTVGQQNWMTYKGPKVDELTKTRREAQVRLADGPEALASCDEVVRLLGFEPIATVRKQRIICHLNRADVDVEVSLDEVDGLGPFVEIEVGVNFSDVDTREMERARGILGDLATELNLSDRERRSYLELLLEKG